MESIFCPQCRLEQPVEHRYCPRCSTELPHDLVSSTPRKSVRIYPGVKAQEGDLEHGYLRVSCYLKEERFDAPEGSVSFTGRHVRFSVWDGHEARCVLSVPETEARDLAQFVLSEMNRLSTVGENAPT